MKTIDQMIKLDVPAQRELLGYYSASVLLQASPKELFKLNSKDITTNSKDECFECKLGSGKNKRVQKIYYNKISPTRKAMVGIFSAIAYTRRRCKYIFKEVR